MKIFNKQSYHMVRQSGFSIMEVLIGIGIFAIGMLALASFQGALTRSTAEAKVRTEAVNIAEEIIEAQRGFSKILSTPGTFDYGDIRSSADPDNPWTSSPKVITRNNVTYSVTQNVTDYYYDSGADSFTSIAPTGAFASSYKTLTVAVAWGDDREFVIQEGVETAGNLGSGSIQISSTISAVSVASVGRVAEESDVPLISPPVAYTPGNPEDGIVALSLGDGKKFKESLTPDPKVVRNDQLVKTTFEVITYSSSNGGEFLRREEFVTVPCECALVSGDGPARRPVIWAGDEYAGGHFVDKPYGKAVGNRQPPVLCETCCRDHHDGGNNQTGDSGDAYSNVYGPFKADTEYKISGQARRTSDHNHYQVDGTTLAIGTDKYLEVCRFVRVDGFLRVAQDFRREDQYAFPADFLDDSTDTSEIGTYSNYITDAVIAYKDDVGVSTGYPTTSPPCVGIPQPPIDGSPTCVAIPNMQGDYPAARGANELPSWTALQTNKIDEQQLRSRGIYFDYMSRDLRIFLSTCINNDDPDKPIVRENCCIQNGVQVSDCSAGAVYMDKTGSANILEILPFFDVQLTKLDSWGQTAKSPPVISLTSEPIKDANKHSRGKSTQLSVGETDVAAESHRGNIGFTDTFAIDKEFDNQKKFATLNVQSLDASGNGGTDDGGRPIIRIEGKFSSEVGSLAIDVIGGGDAFCGLAPSGFWCNVAVDFTTEPTITLFGYEDTHDPDPLDTSDVVEPRCAVSLSAPPLVEKEGSISRAGDANTHTTFSLLDSVGGLLPAGTAYNIKIQSTSCGGGVVEPPA